MRTIPYGSCTHPTSGFDQTWQPKWPLKSSWRLLGNKRPSNGKSRRRSCKKLRRSMMRKWWGWWRKRTAHLTMSRWCSYKNLWGDSMRRSRSKQVSWRRSMHPTPIVKMIRYLRSWDQSQNQISRNSWINSKTMHWRSSRWRVRMWFRGKGRSMQMQDRMGQWRSVADLWEIHSAISRRSPRNKCPRGIIFRGGRTYLICKTDTDLRYVKHRNLEQTEMWSNLGEVPSARRRR